MSDYSKGKIYQIRCNITGDIYIGSTIRTLSQRLSNHKIDITCISRQIITRGDYNISLLENYACNNKDELRIKEREWYDKTKNINKNKPYASIDEIKENKKEYYENNKEKIKEYYNEKFNCECGAIICKSNKSNHFKSIKHQNYLLNIALKICCQMINKIVIN